MVAVVWPACQGNTTARLIVALRTVTLPRALARLVVAVMVPKCATPQRSTVPRLWRASAARATVAVVVAMCRAHVGAAGVVAVAAAGGCGAGGAYGG